MKWNLIPLLDKHVTIANFPDIFDFISNSKKKQILSLISEYSDHKKWLDGRVHFPLWAFLLSYPDHDDAIKILKNARFSARGVSPSTEVKLPFELTYDLAYLLGVLSGDGHIRLSKSGWRGGWGIELAGNDLNFQRMIYMPLIEKLFACKPKLYFNKRKNGRTDVYTRLNSMIAVVYLTKIINMKGGYKVDTLTIPACVYNHENAELKLAFLTGLFDTDGTVTGKRVKFSTVSKSLFVQVMSILDEVGLTYHVNTWLKNKRSSLLYTIIIQKKSSLRDFKKLIGFKILSKKKRLEKLVLSSSG